MGILDFAHRFFRQSKASTPEDMRLYVVGDIHGRCDLLEDIQGRIDKDIDRSGRPGKVIQIFLGDYIDRGESSKDVIDFLLQRPAHQIERIFLKGNHEATILDFINNSGVLSSWRNFGGLETLHSYGVDLNCLKVSGGYDAARQQLMTLMPDEHLNFFRSLQISAEFGDYFFCHAGVRPGVKLKDQKEEDLLWIREEFLEFSGGYEKTIVHGHTPVSQPEIWKNRINIDTGAYISNCLTCLVLENESKRCL